MREESFDPAEAGEAANPRKQHETQARGCPAAAEASTAEPAGKPRSRLPDGELEVMQLVWDSPIPAPREELERRMAALRPMAQTTLLTLLSRLAKKGYLSVEKRGRGSVYTPLISRQDYQAQVSRGFLDRVFGGSIPAFASALTASGLSRAELDELRRLLEEDAL